MIGNDYTAYRRGQEMIAKVMKGWERIAKDIQKNTKDGKYIT